MDRQAAEEIPDNYHAWRAPTPERLRQLERDADIPTEVSDKWDATMHRWFR